MTSFTMSTTTEEVLEGVNLSGKRALVTGVSAGMGVEIARALAAHGADVLGTARDLLKAEAATAGIQAAAQDGSGSLALLDLDLASLASVRATAAAILAEGRRFDIVAANAGVMAIPFSKTVDGFETQFATNHLGHFLLINLIAPLINDGGRVVVLSAAGHRFSDVDLADPNFDSSPYDPWTAYGRSKTANILFAVEFDRRHNARGIRAAALHPGAVTTDLTRHLSEADMDVLRARIKVFVPGTGGPPMTVKSIAQGAAGPVWAAVVANGDKIGGKYCVDYRPSKVAGPIGTHDSVQDYAVDEDNAKALWSKSEEMVGERF